MGRSWLVGGMAVLVAACAHGMRQGDLSEPTIEVSNLGPAAVDLRIVLGVSVQGDTAGFAVGTVYSGRTECFRIQAGTTPQTLRIHSIGGSFHTNTFLPVARSAWRLELRGHPETDRLALEPTDEPCKPGEPSPTR